MKSEKGTSYAWVFLCWLCFLLVLAASAYITGQRQFLFLFAVMVPLGGIAPLIIQVQTGRRLTGMWQLGPHREEGPVVYGIILLLNFIIVSWLLLWAVGAIRKLAGV